MQNGGERKPETARGRWLKQVAWGAAPFLGLLCVWFALVHAAAIPEVFLPPLEKMPGAVWSMFVEESILNDVAVSCFRVLAGFLIAVAVATPLGICMGYSRRVGAAFEPIIGFFRYIPVPVFIPLSLLWFGSGNLQKMAIICLGAFFQLVLMVKDAAGAVRADYFEAAIMLGAPRRDLILRVLVPAALPQIFNSYRVCVGWAWTYLIVAEIVGATTGIGYYIIKAQRYLMVPQIFAAMVLIGVLGMATDLILAAIHRRLFAWDEQGDAKQES